MTNSPPKPSEAQAQGTRGSVARLLDSAQARGRLVVSVDELANACNLSAIAVKRQIAHLADRVVRLPGRPACYLIVPPEHRDRGAPPIDQWLGAYFRLRGEPYYIGLLSAAALHGSSQQAVLVTQVITSCSMRPIELGRVRIEGHVKAGVGATPLTELRLASPMAVSSPEATALDLVAFNASVGGIVRAAQVIFGLLPAMDIAGLKKALAAETTTTTKQRLGYILETIGASKLARIVAANLPERTARILLQPWAVSTKDRPGAVLPWNVMDNINLSKELSS